MNEFLRQLTNAIEDYLPVYQVLAPNGTARPYVTINVYSGSISRCFNDAESFERHKVQIDMWYDWPTDVSEMQEDFTEIRQAIDMKSFGGILFREEMTPRFAIEDSGSGRRSLRATGFFVWERVRPQPDEETGTPTPSPSP